MGTTRSGLLLLLLVGLLRRVPRLRNALLVVVVVAAPLAPLEDSLILFEVDNVMRTMSVSFDYKYREVMEANHEMWGALGLAVLAAVCRFRHKEAAGAIKAAWGVYCRALHQDGLLLLANDLCPPA